MPEGELLTYLTGPAELGPGGRTPRVGDAVNLRLLPGGREFVAWSDSGVRLGQLPPAERSVLTSLTDTAPSEIRGHITALVPRPLQAGTGRIHIRVIAATG